MGTMFRVNEAVFTASVHEGVDLSTPDILVAQLQPPAAQAPAAQASSAKSEAKIS